MIKFEKRFVHFIWSDELEGKMVIFADYISNLQRKVENNEIEHYKEVIQGEALLPFRMKDNRTCWQFVYYDPYYELKCAHEQGNKIQALFGSKWLDLPNPGWDFEPEYYRVKPEEPEEYKPVTNRELARWLARGNGECKQLNGGTCIWTDFHYWIGEENTPAEYLIRKWEDEQWVIPTREYMGLE